MEGDSSESISTPATKSRAQQAETLSDPRSGATVLKQVAEFFLKDRSNLIGAVVRHSGGKPQCQSVNRNLWSDDHLWRGSKLPRHSIWQPLKDV
ncbi:hypothetical protein PS723_01874 [Pseudomonas fluorescens]|uniref:Uncharacterized protein n=1 Tax=Pseudomonas fluorescens TaxID=294 RepID=A0A5E7C4H0_PSEFL|nr:hypothetical protein PS723_01874 [Pseudomonas fluorescens]